MAHHHFNRLHGAWRANKKALTTDNKNQVISTRARHGLYITKANKLIKNGGNRKVILGETLNPKFVTPRGKAWIRVTELSQLYLP